MKSFPVVVAATITTTMTLLTGGWQTVLAMPPQTGSGGAFVIPVSGSTVTQRFGCTSFSFEPRDPNCPSGHFHSGIDLAVPVGTPVRATGSGIAHIFSLQTGYGLHVIVDHGQGLSSLYGHLSAVTVSEGDPVAAGVGIGLVGTTGNSTGPHLHFEIRRDNIPEDPSLDMPLP